MTEHVEKRFTVIAGAVAIISALWLMLKPDRVPKVLVQGSTFSPNGDLSDPVLFDQVGAPNAVADPPGPTAAAIASVTGQAPASGVRTSGDPAQTAATAYLYYNLPPATAYSPGGIERDHSHAGGGCGCGGSCGGCAGGGCANKPPVNLFVDGRGNCLSSIPGTVINSIEGCIPGYMGRGTENLQAALAHFGNDYNVSEHRAALPGVPWWN